MREKKTKYNIINIAIISMTVILFVCDYWKIDEIFKGQNILSVFILIVTVILVHIVKAVRLYLALYGSNIDFATHIKTYCKITPVSVVFPYKLGEFFRMYCYGKLLGNVLKGIVIILFDRIMDTIALVTAILLVCLFNGERMNLFVYFLLIFIVLMLLIYLVFPGVYRFWKKYLLKAKASENGLALLKMLDRLNTIYREIENVTKGRGIILYFMSLIAWGAEIGCITLLNELSGESKLNQIIVDYLTSAMSGNPSVELKQFVFVSVILLTASYIIIKVLEKFSRKKVCE